MPSQKLAIKVPKRGRIADRRWKIWSHGKKKESNFWHAKIHST
jgi:hypothetical protein